MEFLSQKGVPYTEKDISVDPQARNDLVNKLNSRATPTIVIDGEVVIGFDRAKLQALLGV